MHLYMNDMNDGCLATAEGMSEKIFRVPGRNNLFIKPMTFVTATVWML